MTVASLLKANGYQTAALGKWHLGMNWQRKPDAITDASKKSGPSNQDSATQVDWTIPILNGPTSLGFDYFYGIAASLDMPPFVFIENDRVTRIPTTEKKWVRNGAAAEDFEAEAVMPELTRKATSWIAQRATEQKPFFLYLAYSALKFPRKSGQGVRMFVVVSFS